MILQDMCITLNSVLFLRGSPVSYWVVLTLHVTSHICFFVSLYYFKTLGNKVAGG